MNLFWKEIVAVCLLFGQGEGSAGTETPCFESGTYGRGGARGRERYSVAESAVHEFIRWYDMPWES